MLFSCFQNSCPRFSEWYKHFSGKYIFRKRLSADFPVVTRPAFNKHKTFMCRSASLMNVLRLFNLDRVVH